MKQPHRVVLLNAFALSFFSFSLFASEPAIVVDPGDDDIAWGPCPDFMPAGCEIAVVHGDPTKPNVDILFRVPGGAVIPSHRHTSAERMILLSGKLEVTYEGQDTVTIRAGSYAYGPAGRPHDAYCVRGEDCVLFIAFVQPLDAIPLDDA